MLKCHYCDFINYDEFINTNHVVDTHSTSNKCQSCGVVFPTKSEMIEHTKYVHGFIYSSTDRSKSSNNQIDCHDCEYKFNNKFELMKHNKNKSILKRDSAHITMAQDMAVDSQPPA